MKLAVATMLALTLAACMPTPDGAPRNESGIETPWPYDPVAYAEQTRGLERGVGFPLSSGATPTLYEVGVQWVADVELIDVSIVLNGQRLPSDTTLDELVDFGEFCLRYGTPVARLAVPEEEWQRIRLLTVLYRPTAGAPMRATDLGFGFLAQGGQCTIAPPFPPGLANQALTRARAPLQTQATSSDTDTSQPGG